MKSLLFYGISCLFMAAAAKPFVKIGGPETASSWATFRSYPHAKWADDDARDKKWAQAAHHYAQALIRNPREQRFARGVLTAWGHMLDQVPRASFLPVRQQQNMLLTQAIPGPLLQPVRFDVPQSPLERRQQTDWRGPIVALAATERIVPFQKTAAPAPVLQAASHIQAASPIHISPATPFIAADSRGASSRWSFNSSATLRASDVPSTLPGIGDFGGSQSGAELRWQINTSREKPLQLAAATYMGTDTHFSIHRQTTQAVIGLRYKPFEKLNMVVGADRLIKLGSQSRNAFALRLMADTGANYDRPVDRSRWLHWHAGIDSALIGVNARDLFASGDARIGMGFRVTDTLSVTPYVGANALLQQAGTTQTLVEAGPGVWMRARLSDQSRLDLRVAYRVNIAGNAPTRNGVVAQVALGF